MKERSAIDDDYYKHLVINTQSRTFEDANYVNSIGSKVVIRPLSETLEFSAKKTSTSENSYVEGSPPSSQDAMDTGDLPSGEIPESTEEAEAVDLPSGEMAVEATADVPEDLPTGKRSRTEAKEEDVEMKKLKKKNLHKLILMHHLHLKKKHLTLRETLKLMTMFLRHPPKSNSVQTVF